MMKILGKIPVLLLIFALLLSGCGQPQTKKEAEPSAEASQSAEVLPEESTEEVPEPLPVSITVEEAAKLDAGSVIAPDQLPSDGVSDFFYSEEISDSVFECMDGVSYKEGCPVTREELRYVRVLHWGFDGEIHVGELVCNKSIAGDMTEIFEKLYHQEYLIEKMLLVDNYDGDDELSMEDNNTSCFNYRPVSGTSTLSRHSYGLAIDINPLYNPYVTKNGYEPANAGDYIDRTKNTPYKITSSDPCYLQFADHGFAWGGWWQNVKDYQHFEQ